MRRLPVLAATWLALALAGCGGDAATPAAEPPPVLVERAAAYTVLDRVEASGELRARAEARVAAQSPGEVTAILADEGQEVGAGQVVVEIDPERRQLEVADSRASAVQAQAQLEEARREAERLGQLAERGVASEARLDEARTALRLARSRLAAAEARLGLAERALRDASVAAPFAGRLARRHVNAGEFVSAGQPLFDLVALDPVEVEFHLSEIDSTRVALGQEVDVRVAPFGDEVFRAEVSAVAPTIDTGTRTRRVKALLPNPDGRLLPGTFARVDLGVAERSDVVMIPKEAILLRSDGAVLYRLVGSDRVARVRVETGVYRDALVEVRGAIGPGDWVVVRGHSELVDGAAVSLRNADGTAFDAAALGLRGEGDG